jgi:hypothetical protein
MHLKRDSRGRLRVTYGGVRVEANSKNVVRVYHRYNPAQNCERRTDTFTLGEVTRVVAGLQDVRDTIAYGG